MNAVASIGIDIGIALAFLMSRSETCIHHCASALAGHRALLSANVLDQPTNTNIFVLLRGEGGGGGGGGGEGGGPGFEFDPILSCRALPLSSINVLPTFLFWFLLVSFFLGSLCFWTLCFLLVGYFCFTDLQLNLKYSVYCRCVAFLSNLS